MKGCWWKSIAENLIRLISTISLKLHTYVTLEKPGDINTGILIATHIFYCTLCCWFEKNKNWFRLYSIPWKTPYTHMCGDNNFDNKLQAIIRMGGMLKTMILAYLKLAKIYDDNIWISHMMVIMITVPSPLICFHKYERWQMERCLWSMMTALKCVILIQPNYGSNHDTVIDSNYGCSNYGPSSPKPRAWSGLSANLTATSASTFCIWHSKKCIWSYSTLKQWIAVFWYKTLRIS